jgi:hypothetical protein
MTIRANFVVSAAIVALPFVASVAHAGERSVTIANKTRYPIVSLRMRSSDTDKWSNDLLAEQVNGYVKMTVIGVGTAKKVTVPDYSACRCNLFVVFADGHRAHLNTDICKSEKVDINGS